MDPVQVDLAAKMTEFEAQQSLDRFLLAAIPRLFEWLRWAATIAALRYLEEVSESAGLRLINGALPILLLFYLQAYFFRLQFSNIPLLNRRPLRGRVSERTVSLVLSGLLAYGTHRLVSEVVEAIIKKGT